MAVEPDTGTQSEPLAIPDLCLVVLVGASGSGKSTFAGTHFAETEVVSSDRARAMVSDDENDQAATSDAFELLHFWAGKRLANGRLTVIDATNVQRHARAGLVALAKEHDVLPVAIVIDTPPEVCRERNRTRPDRNFGSHVITRQTTQLRKSLRHLRKEGFRYVHHLEGEEAMAGATIVRQRRWTDLRDRSGPFDLIGDIHGCHEELVELLTTLGYRVTGDAEDGSQTAGHVDGRTAVFVGDLVDRGPGTVETVRLVKNMVADGQALCVAGNHEAKLVRALQGRKVNRTHGLAESLEQIETKCTEEERADMVRFLDGLLSHYVLDDGRLVVCHAGLPERFHNRSSGRVRSFCLYGETTGETDEFGLPVRYQWADDYRGDAAVVYGHTPVPTAEWINNTICIDTGCVFGGELTGLRWPEKELVTVPARAEYYEPVKPLRDVRVGEEVPGGGRRSPLLEYSDVSGRRRVETSLMGRLTVPEDQNTAALEVASRFMVDPRWLAYLPPTMAPSATATSGPRLERPEEAFDYYAGQGVKAVVCQEKHMGSRAVAIVGRTAEAMEQRFGLADHEGALGVVVTRTGRSFFEDPVVSKAMVDEIRGALDAADAWDRHQTNWFILDGELLPWSAKAGPLIRRQFAPVAAAGLPWAEAGLGSIDAAIGRGVEGLAEIRDRLAAKPAAIEAYRDAYRSYVTPTDGITGVSFAPFAFLAFEGTVAARRDNRWHLEQCDRLVAASRFMTGTDRVEVELDNRASRQAAADWWLQLTSRPTIGEGMVVKPVEPIGRGGKGLIQPGLKCRGFDYLRLVYGPEYPFPENLARLRDRRLNRKRSLALREFALGIEALDRFVAQEPLWRVHECVFSILALESEPVDPRL